MHVTLTQAHELDTEEVRIKKVLTLRIKHFQ